MDGNSGIRSRSVNIQLGSATSRNGRGIFGGTHSGKMERSMLLDAIPEAGLELLEGWRAQNS